MAFKFFEKDLDAYALGAAFLGSGGGGDPSYALMISKDQFSQKGSINIITLNELEDDDLIAPVAFMGAPLVGKEKVPALSTFKKLIEEIEFFYKKPVKALCVTEIGGGNALVPLYLSHYLNLPVIDGDLLGRAFPELQMITTNVVGIHVGRSFFSDAFGNVVCINCSDFEHIETYARSLSISFGSRASMVVHAITKKEAEKVLITNTLSLALSLGNSLIQCACKEFSVDETFERFGIVEFARGIVSGIRQEVREGFLQGDIQIISPNSDISWSILLKNEYLFAYEGDHIVAQTPDIISILEEDTLIPLTSESLFFGARVRLVYQKTASIWYTKRGLELVGPHVFQVKNN